MTITFKGHIASKGKAEGEALVCHGPLKFFFAEDEGGTGLIHEPGHELHGKSIKDKVVVLTCGCGCTWWGVYLMKLWGAHPKAIVAMKPWHQLIEDIIFIEIPMVWGFDHNLLDIIETGDHLVVDGDNGTVVVTKKS